MQGDEFREEGGKQKNKQGGCAAQIPEPTGAASVAAEALGAIKRSPNDQAQTMEIYLQKEGKHGKCNNTPKQDRSSPVRSTTNQASDLLMYKLTMILFVRQHGLRSPNAMAGNRLQGLFIYGGHGRGPHAWRGRV